MERGLVAMQVQVSVLSTLADQFHSGAATTFRLFVVSNTHSFHLNNNQHATSFATLVLITMKFAAIIAVALPAIANAALTFNITQALAPGEYVAASTHIDTIVPKLTHMSQVQEIQVPNHSQVQHIPTRLPPPMSNRRCEPGRLRVR